jgi:hypothetical protein
MSILKLIFFSIIVTIIGYTCNSSSFSKGVLDDAQRVHSYYKKSMFELDFTGDILKKNYCEKCNYATKHLVDIEITSDTKKDFFTKFGFAPYTYILDLDKKHIQISVTPKIYESVNVGGKISKFANSNNVLIDGMEYQLLSNNEFEWLANPI